LQGKIHEQMFARGDITQKLVEIGTTDKRGTLVRFKPDYEIFEELDFSYETLRQHFQETAFLTKGLKITLIDEREGQEKEDIYPGNKEKKDFT